ncbi:hypothetical protein C8Q79DRAFT_233096 [Trametes meyenii]|nr:hypothetical protein C8Q79DRAFT_233096 [Trametes meyenii]
MVILRRAHRPTVSFRCIFAVLGLSTLWRTHAIALLCVQSSHQSQGLARHLGREQSGQTTAFTLSGPIFLVQVEAGKFSKLWETQYALLHHETCPFGRLVNRPTPKCGDLCGHPRRMNARARSHLYQRD